MKIFLAKFYNLISMFLFDQNDGEYLNDNFLSPFGTSKTIEPFIFPFSASLPEPRESSGEANQLVLSNTPLSVLILKSKVLYDISLFDLFFISTVTLTNSFPSLG